MLKLDPGFLAIWDRLMSKDAMTRSEGIRSAMRMYMRDRSGLTFHDSAKELDVAGDLDA
jgi:metal-responsive CopG/Arc/MetJ family transcriptional regulator